MVNRNIILASSLILVFWQKSLSALTLRATCARGAWWTRTSRRPTRTGTSTRSRSARPSMIGRLTRRPIGKISAKCCSFSAVSTPIFARKYAFFSIFQNLQDYLSEILEIWGQFCRFCNICKKFAEFSRKLLIFKPIFC